ncbi:MAG TPA: SDR family oxidoreductase [Nocardioidaceae bacterium]
MTELRGATVLLTGASSGIGEATARTLAGRGARLLLTGRDEARLAAAAEGLDARRLAADLADEAAPAALAAWALREGPPRVVVHNAGAGLAAPLADTTPEQVERLWRVNVTAPIALTRSLLPALQEQGGGHLVFVTSIAGLLGVPRESVYAASKAALQVFARSVSAELARTGTVVTTIAPGVVATPFFERRGEPYERRFPRPMPPERVAAAIADAVVANRAEVVLPRWLRLPVWLEATAPDLYHRLARRWA